jgi:hypothetical protein
MAPPAQGFGARAIATAEHTRPMTKKVSAKLPSRKAINEPIMLLRMP